MKAVGLSLWSVFLLAIPALAAEDGPAKRELEKLQGAWKLASLEALGVSQAFTEPTYVWVIKGHRVFYGGKELAELKIDPATTPKSMDLAFLTPKRVHEAIYLQEDGTLKVCASRITEGVKERPQEFTTKDKADWRLLVFKRDENIVGDGGDLLAGYVGIALAISDRKEIVVTAVFEKSPAETAGLKMDDVLIQVAGVPVQALEQTVSLFRGVKPGGEVKVRIKRAGKEIDLTAKAELLPFFVLDV